MRETVAIVGPIDERGRNTIKEALADKFIIKEVASEDEYDSLADVSYIILRTLKLNAKAIQKLSKLKLIQRWGVGYDSVDIKAAGERGIQVAVTSGINSVPVAEYAVLLMLSVYRNLIATHHNVVAGKWRDESLIERSYVISGKSVGLVGLGSIGKLVAQRVQGFGATVFYYDPFRPSAEEEKRLGLSYRDFDELVGTVDIISLHLPLTSETKNLIDGQVLSRMKPTAIIVNTSRGGIINEQDLYEALTDRRILGAGLDVFEDEPVKKENKLLKLDNVVLSSHSAGNSVDNSVNMAKRCVDNILKVCNSEPLPKTDLVNKQYLVREGR